MGNKSYQDYISLYGERLVLKWLERAELNLKRRKEKKRPTPRVGTANQKLKALDKDAYLALLKRLTAEKKGV
jgi:hypothetical protein